VQGNAFGSTFLGNSYNPNGLANIALLTNPSKSLIGGTNPAEENLLANGNPSVLINSGLNNAVRGNRFLFPAGMLIDLIGEGPTLNDAGDADNGPNGLQNYPLFTVITNNGTNTALSGTLNSLPNASYALDFYSGDGCTSDNSSQTFYYRGSGSVTTDSSGNGSFTVVVDHPGNYWKVTATDSAGNTSEFSPCQQAFSTIPPSTFTVINTNDDGPGSLRAAIAGVNGISPASPHTIVFNIPGPGPHIISPSNELNYIWHR
jgi:hypothetical protein